MEDEAVHILKQSIINNSSKIYPQNELFERTIQKSLTAFRLEMNLLLLAYREGVVDNLVQSLNSNFDQTLLIQKLQSTTGLETKYASWAISSWIHIFQDISRPPVKQVGIVIPLYEDEIRLDASPELSKLFFHRTYGNEKKTCDEQLKGRDTSLSEEKDRRTTQYRPELENGSLNLLERKLREISNQMQEYEGFIEDNDDMTLNSHKHYPSSSIQPNYEKFIIRSSQEADSYADLQEDKFYKENYYEEDEYEDEYEYDEDEEQDSSDDDNYQSRRYPWSSRRY